MSDPAAVTTQPMLKATFTPALQGVLQRACACGQHTGGGECEACRGQREPMLQRSAVDSSARPGPKSGLAGAPAFKRDFSAIRVSPATPGVPQARLTLGQPGDRFEREADQVADGMMRSKAPGGRQLVNASQTPAPDTVQRAMDETGASDASASPTAETPQAASGSEADAGQSQQPAEAGAGGNEGDGAPEQVAAVLLETDPEDSDKAQEPSGEQQAPAAEAGGDAAMQARELPGQTPRVSAPQERRIQALRGGGQPLPAFSRAFFEPRFGQDLGHVRVHTGTEASRLSSSVQARAFTVGRDMVFGEGQYQPASPSGQWLLAHELTHVLQQQEGLARAPIESPQVQRLAVQHTGQAQVQGGFFGNIWKGIKKAAGAVWGGIKKGAGAVWSGVKKGASAAWSGIKWAAGKVWGGIKAIGKWSWNVLKAGAALAWNLVVKFPERVWRLIKHLGSGIAGVASWLWEGLKLAWHGNFKAMGKWFVDGILSGAAWVGRLAGKLADIAGFGEIWDLLFQIIKFNTRPLTSVEQSEAHKTFKSSISYWQVRVDEYSLISAIGAYFKGGGGMGVTTFHTINFNQKIHASPGSSDMHWLTHEMTHVSQYEHAGSQYLGEAIHAQASGGYDYKGETRPLWRPASNPSPNPGGKHFRDFNREQQADIAADYYYSLFGTPVPSGKFTPINSDYEPDIDELRKGDL